MSERKYYNSADIAERWGISPAKYQHLCRAREIEHINLGTKKRGLYFSTAAQVERFLAKRLVRVR